MSTDRPDGVVDFVPSPDHYPFGSRWLDSSVGPLHYVDEGTGRPLLLLHGLGCALLIGRILHGFVGLNRSAGVSTGRFVGTLLTWVMLLLVNLPAYSRLTMKKLLLRCSTAKPADSAMACTASTVSML